MTGRLREIPRTDGKHFVVEVIATVVQRNAAWRAGLAVADKDESAGHCLQEGSEVLGDHHRFDVAVHADAANDVSRRLKRDRHPLLPIHRRREFMRVGVIVLSVQIDTVEGGNVPLYQ